MNANQPSNVRPSVLSVAFISAVGMRAGVAFKHRRGRNEMEITRSNGEWRKYEVVIQREMQTRRIGGVHREKQVVLFRTGAADGKTTSGTIINERVKPTATDIVRVAIAGPPVFCYRRLRRKLTAS